MAIEILTSGLFTSKSDVWSFGIVLWEMCTYGDQPYFELNNEEVIRHVKNGSRLKLPPNSPAKLLDLTT
jgi:serine/threonine protein kinase